MNSKGAEFRLEFKDSRLEFKGGVRMISFFLKEGAKSARQETK